MTNDESAIRNLIQTWMNAGNNLDVILPLMDEDVVFLQAGRRCAVALPSLLHRKAM